MVVVGWPWLDTKTALLLHVPQQEMGKKCNGFASWFMHQDKDRKITQQLHTVKTDVVWGNYFKLLPIKSEIMRIRNISLKTFPPPLPSSRLDFPHKLLTSYLPAAQVDGDGVAPSSSQSSAAPEWGPSHRRSLPLPPALHGDWEEGVEWTMVSPDFILK